MYSSFRVKNFRGFRLLEVSDIARVNLIAGKNNSGKTALMEAIHINSGNRSPKTLLRPQSPRGIEDIMFRSIRGYYGEWDIVSWSSIFLHFDTSHAIEMNADFHSLPKRLSESKSGSSLNIACLPTDHDRFLEVLRQYDAEDEDDVNVLEFTTGFDSVPFHVVLSSERTRSSRSKSQTLFQSEFVYTRETDSPRDDNERFADMKQSNKDSVLVGALQILEPRLRQLEILYERIHADIGINKSIPLSSMGDGINRIASVILALSTVPNGVIFIDEIENGLHYSIQEQVWKAIAKLARDLDIQVFATTHSLEMIRAAHAAFSESETYDFRLHRLDRDATTYDINAVTYNEFGMEALAAFDFKFEVRG